jgi:hypothetical protein
VLHAHAHVAVELSVLAISIIDTDSNVKDFFHTIKTEIEFRYRSKFVILKQKLSATTLVMHLVLLCKLFRRYIYI